MKKYLCAIAVVITILLSSCNAGPRNTATTYMKSLQNRDFEKAAACCGVSKDETSKQIVIAILLEQHGTPDNSIRDFKVLSDTLVEKDEKAIVYMDLIYTNRTIEQNVPIYLRKMGRKWIVTPFEVR